MKTELIPANEPQEQQLAALLAAKRLPHAVLIEGPPGSGREEMANRLAKAAVCTGETIPCGRCAGCRKADKGVHPDIAVLASAGNARSLHISEIRRLREQAYISPNEALRRVFILQRAQDMSPQAQNALLKILEEPPATVMILLICENADQLLPTIRSRAVIFSRTLADETAQLQAKLKKGKSAQIAAGLAGALCGGNELEILKALGPLEKDKSRQKEVFALLLGLLSTAARSKAGQDAGGIEAATELARAVSYQQLAAYYQTVADTLVQYDRNPNNTLLLTMICVRLSEVRNSND